MKRKPLPKFSVTDVRGDVTVKVNRVLAPIEIPQLVMALCEAQNRAYKWRAENNPEAVVRRGAANDNRTRAR